MKTLKYFTLVTLLSIFSLQQSNASFTVAEDAEKFQAEEAYPDEISDPFESFNRAMYTFNWGVDKVLFRPLAEVYSFVPSFARKGVRNVLAVAGAPLTFVNDILQLNGQRAGETLVRTFINATLGLFVFDMATELGAPYHTEDFGQTLSVAGVPSGPYLVLPFIGPSSARNLVGTGVDVAINPLNWLWYSADISYAGTGIYAMNGLDRRTEARAFMDELEKAADPYARVRILYWQSRNYHINNEKLDENDSPRPLDE